VGAVHADVPWEPPPADPAVVHLHRRIKDLFDPTGRLAPGRSPLAAAARVSAGAGGDLGPAPAGSDA
jgi:FAD linked oxidases, C-terminal domain